MGQSLVKNYIHLIFSTKNREPFILEEFDEKLHSFLATRCLELESPALAIGGYFDHVHIVCVLSKKIALMDLLKVLKSRSSNWMKTLDSRLLNFYWQDGYGAFSVSPNRVDAAIKYVLNQREHHKKVTFKDEYISLLKQYDIDYNEDFLWA